MNKIKILEDKIKKLEKLAYYDHLTGVLNRRGFFEETEKIFKFLVFRRKERERRTGYRLPFSIIFIDIDDFKKINDIYGHNIGDKVLKKAVSILKKRLRFSDILARFGGEEFIVAFIGVDLNTAKHIAEDLRKLFEKTKISVGKNKKIKVKISIGVVEYKQESSLNELINKSDKAMYQAKKQGKNRVVVL